MRLYVDSNVIISYLRSEFGGLTKLQFYKVKEFLSACKIRGHVFIISDLCSKEILENAYSSREEIEEMLKTLGIKFEAVRTAPATAARAREILRSTGIHYPDNIHVQLAVEAKSDAIVTWNTRDFIKAKKLVPCLRPDELS